MRIEENDPLDSTVPPFVVLDENDNMIFYATTRDECENYINSL